MSYPAPIYRRSARLPSPGSPPLSQSRCLSVSLLAMPVPGVFTTRATTTPGVPAILKLPSRRRGTSSRTSPCSRSAPALGRVPLRLLPGSLPAGAFFSCPRCSVSSWSRPFPGSPWSAARAGRPGRSGTGPAPGPADQLLGRLLLTRRLRLSFFFATFSSVAVITTPLPLNTLLSDQCRKHR